MNQELIDNLVVEYTKTYIRPFKKVAARAFEDGFKEAIRIARQRLGLEMENTEYDFGHDVKKGDD
jgi:hypothetical protein